MSAVNQRAAALFQEQWFPASSSVRLYLGTKLWPHMIIMTTPTCWCSESIKFNTFAASRRMQVPTICCWDLRGVCLLSIASLPHDSSLCRHGFYSRRLQIIEVNEAASKILSDVYYHFPLKTELWVPTWSVFLQSYKPQKSDLEDDRAVMFGWTQWNALHVIFAHLSSPHLKSEVQPAILEPKAVYFSWRYFMTKASPIWNAPDTPKGPHRRYSWQAWLFFQPLMGVVWISQQQI